MEENDYLKNKLSMFDQLIENGAEHFRHLWRKIIILSLHRCITTQTLFERQREENGTDHI